VIDQATFGYTAQRIDPETNGLYYYRARHYSPAWGRFLQPDPIGTTGGVNLYAYVGNDPLNFTDPDGLVKDAAVVAFSQSAAPELAESQAVTDFVQQYPRAAMVEGSIGVVATLGIPAAGTFGFFATTGGVAESAIAAADFAQAAGATRGVAGALRVGSTTFTDISSGAARQIGQIPTPVNPAIESLINRLPTNSPFAGSCAEIGCLSQALNSGVNPAGGSVGTAAIRAAGNVAHGAPVTPCVTCSQVLRYFGVTY
jgi:RHS repeat-associated protein